MASEGDVRAPFAPQMLPGALGRFVRPLSGRLDTSLTSARRPKTSFLVASAGDVRPPFAPPNASRRFGTLREASVGPVGRFFDLCQASLDIFSSGVRR